MKRRDFMLLKTEGNEKVAELSCEELYMQFADALQEVQQPQEQGRLDAAGSWSGEPDAEIPRGNLNEFFRYLERQLESTDVLRMSNPDWLQDQDFKARVYEMLTEFRARGGEIQFSQNTDA